MHRQSETRAGNQQRHTRTRNLSLPTQANHTARGARKQAPNQGAIHAASEDTTHISNHTACHQCSRRRRGDVCFRIGSVGARSWASSTAVCDCKICYKEMLWYVTACVLHVCYRETSWVRFLEAEKARKLTQAQFLLMHSNHRVSLSQTGTETPSRHKHKASPVAQTSQEHYLCAASAVAMLRFRLLQCSHNLRSP